MKRACVFFISLFASVLLAISTIAWAQQTSPSPTPVSTATAGTSSGAGQTSQPKQPAAAASPATPGRLPVLVVTATRLEQPITEIGTSVSVIEAPEMQAQKLVTVGDALREIPGVEITQEGSPGSLTGVQIRGGTSEQTLILVDGVEVNDASDGEFDMANLTVDNVNRVEVLRGNGGALYGSHAVGGVVNIISDEGGGPPKFSLMSEGGNRATERQVVTASGSEGSLNYSGALSYFSTTGFRPINDSSDNLAGNIRLDEHLSDDTVLRFFARYSRSNVSLVNYSIADGIPLDPNAHERNEFMLFKGALEHRFGENLLVRWNAAYVRSEIRDNAYPFPANPATESDGIADENRSTTLDAAYNWGSGFRSLLGFDFKDRWAHSGDNSNYPQYDYQAITVFRHRRQEYAGYAQQEGSFFNGRLLATAGFRVDGNSDFGKEVSPAWSVAIPIDEINTTLRGSYSEGFRAPSFDDLYYPGYGNPNLGPELSSEYDGGFTHRFGELASFTATYFSRRVHNLIVPVPCAYSATCPDGDLAGNVGRADAQGVELEPGLGPWRGFQLSGNFTFIDETHRSSGPTVRPLRVPKKSAAGILQYEHSGMFRYGDKVRANLVYTFVGDRDDVDQTGAIRTHVAYHLFNAVLSYSTGIAWREIQDEEFYVRVQNLFDRNYAQILGFKSPPINFVAGVKFDFGAAPTPSAK